VASTFGLFRSPTSAGGHAENEISRMLLKPFPPYQVWSLEDAVNGARHDFDWYWKQPEKAPWDRNSRTSLAGISAQYLGETSAKGAGTSGILWGGR
jgi:hypothetical protein